MTIMDYSYLAKTKEIYSMILGEYEKLDEEGILVIEYTGFVRDLNLYHLFGWYINYGNQNSKYHHDNRYFVYDELIELLKNSNIEFIDNHISTETIKEQFEKSESLKYSFQRDSETTSRIYLASRVKEKIKTRELKR